MCREIWGDRFMEQDQRPLWKKLKEIPELPGIYQMLDSRGRIIYIGKSKCLKRRVHSYFVESPAWDKAGKMAPLIYDINYIVTDTHLEAMLLECEMIKSIKPHFNSLMKNDERYVYLTISSENRGKLLKTTTVREPGSFGLFRSRSRLQNFIDSMENLYPFTEEKRKLKFDYHVFPAKMTAEEQEETRRILKKLFTDLKVMEEFLNLLEKKMKKAAKEQKFETALKYRDLMELTGYVRKNLREYGEWISSRFICAEETDKGTKYFFIDKGLVIHKAFLTDERHFLIDENEQGNDTEIENGNKNGDKHKDKNEDRSRRENFLQEFKEISLDIIKSGKMVEMTEKQLADYQDIVFSECSKMKKYPLQ